MSNKDSEASFARTAQGTTSQSNEVKIKTLQAKLGTIASILSESLTLGHNEIGEKLQLKLLLSTDTTDDINNITDALRIANTLLKKRNDYISTTTEIIESIEVAIANISDEMKIINKKLNIIGYNNNNFAKRNEKLSTATHEWLALQSMGIDTNEVRVTRFVPVRVYLSEFSEDAAKDVTDAISELLEVYNFDIAQEFPPIIKSWFKKWFAQTKDVVSQPEVIERLEKMQRALELKGLGQPQADIDNKQTDSVIKLIEAVEKMPQAAIHIGSILLIKYQNDTGPIVEVRTLTQNEMIFIENNRDLLSCPRELISAIGVNTIKHKKTPALSIDQIKKNTHGLDEAHIEERSS